MNPGEIADRYFATVRSRDVDALVALYADDAVINLPNGAQIAGRAAIGAFQADVYARGAPYPTPGSRVVGENEIAVEIRAELADGTARNTANFFYIGGEGLIERLNVYARGA